MFSFCWKPLTTSLVLCLLLPSCSSFIRYIHLFYKFFSLSIVLPTTMLDWTSTKPSHPLWLIPTWLIHQLALLLHNSLVHLSINKQNVVKWRIKYLYGGLILLKDLLSSITGVELFIFGVTYSWSSEGVVSWTSQTFTCNLLTRKSFKWTTSGILTSKSTLSETLSNLSLWRTCSLKITSLFLMIFWFWSS